MNPPYRGVMPAQTQGPVISIVIPAYNAAATLGAQLEALASQNYGDPLEIIVVDNGSTDGTAALVRSWTHSLPTLRLVQAAERRGANYARNVGARAACGDLLLFCDSDDIVAKGWVEAMAAAAADHELIGGALEMRTLGGRGDDPPLFRAEDRDLPVGLGFLPFAAAANLGIRASLLRDLGGWSEQFTHGGDDVDLCWRAQFLGHRAHFAPQALVKYRPRKGARDLARQNYSYGLAQARLYAHYRDVGVERPPWTTVLKSWLWLMAHVPDLLVSVRRRRLWIRAAAQCCGRLVGSLRERVVFL